MSSCPDCIFEIHQLWQSGFGRVYSNSNSNCCCSCSFEAEIIKIGQSSHKMYSNYHHHHVAPLARISLTLSRHFSLSFIASGRSLGLHPVSSHSCCMYVCTSICGGPQEYIAYELVFASPAVSRVSGSSNLYSFRDGSKCPYSWCLVECCRQDLFNTALNILV